MSPFRWSTIMRTHTLCATFDRISASRYLTSVKPKNHPDLFQERKRSVQRKGNTFRPRGTAQVYDSRQMIIKSCYPHPGKREPRQSRHHRSVSRIRLTNGWAKPSGDVRREIRIAIIPRTLVLHRPLRTRVNRFKRDEAGGARIPLSLDYISDFYDPTAVTAAASSP